RCDGFIPSIDPDSQLGSAMSSFMSSQSSNSAAPAKSCGFRELGARSQRIDDSSEEVSPRSQFTDASGNSSPKGDLSKLVNVRRRLPQAMGGLTIAGNLALAHLDRFPACPGFVECAARFSSLDDRNRCWLSGHLELPGNAKLHSSRGIIGIRSDFCEWRSKLRSSQRWQREEAKSSSEEQREGYYSTEIRHRSSQGV
ncbi:unnamed protein product, partial [Musa hybrid cultivar]